MRSTISKSSGATPRATIETPPAGGCRGSARRPWGRPTTLALGRMVPELMRDDIRETLVASYRIVYQIRTDDLLVLTIFEGHRLLPLDEPEAPGGR